MSPNTSAATGEPSAIASDSPTAVDWSALRERIAASVQGLRRRPPGEVLAERALALARPLADGGRGRRRSAGSAGDARAGGAEGDRAADDVPALVVTAADGRYALALTDVVEVVRADRLVPLPGADATVAGVLPWRGRVLAAVALAPALAPALTPAADTRHVVVAGTVATPVALLVDAVAAVQTMPSALFEPTADADAAAARVPTRGVTSDAVAALDLDELRRRLTGTPDTT